MRWWLLALMGPCSGVKMERVAKKMNLYDVETTNLWSRHLNLSPQNIYIYTYFICKYIYATVWSHNFL